MNDLAKKDGVQLPLVDWEDVARLFKIGGFAALTEDTRDTQEQNFSENISEEKEATVEQLNQKKRILENAMKQTTNQDTIGEIQRLLQEIETEIQSL